MSRQPSFHDIKTLSAYLDGQLTRSEQVRMEARLQSDPGLQAALEDLRQVRALLRQAPKRRAPRNFTLSPKTARVKPPVPRLVPILNWASVVTALLLFCVFSGNIFGNALLNLGAAAPMLTSQETGYGGGSPEEPPIANDQVESMAMSTESAVQESGPLTAAPEGTPIPDVAIGRAPAEVTQEVETPTLEPRALKPDDQPSMLAIIMTIVQAGLLCLVVLLAGSALLLRWQRDRSFRQKLRRK